jgi:hypothetical protein
MQEKAQNHSNNIKIVVKMNNRNKAINKNKVT